MRSTHRDHRPPALHLGCWSALHPGQPTAQIAQAQLSCRHSRLKAAMMIISYRPAALPLRRACRPAAAGRIALLVVLGAAGLLACLSDAAATAEPRPSSAAAPNGHAPHPHVQVSSLASSRLVVLAIFRARAPPNRRRPTPAGHPPEAAAAERRLPSAPAQGSQKACRHHRLAAACSPAAAGRAGCQGQQHRCAGSSSTLCQYVMPHRQSPLSTPARPMPTQAATRP